MKTNFKPLALAAAVAATTAGFAGVTQAAISQDGLGDLAIVPYYTVNENYVTGVHIINTSNATQVVKLRFRRGSDSMDALDFNLIMSPKDEWTGFIDGEEGNVVVRTEDTTCTAPLTGRPGTALAAAGVFPMPDLYEAGATEGYIEVIGMAQVAPTFVIPPLTLSPAQTVALTGNPLNLSALHGADGVPANCASAETNFFRVATTIPLVAPFATAGDEGTQGVYDSDQTVESTIPGALGLSNLYVDTPNVLNKNQKKT